MLGGFTFAFKIEGISLKVFGSNVIKRKGRDLPSVEVDIGVIAILLAIQNERVGAKILLKEIKVLEYFRRDQVRAYSRQVNNIADNQMLTSIFDEMDHKAGRGSVQSRQTPSRQMKGTLAGV